MREIGRASGVLLHPTSLPSPYGIGDIGRASHEFVWRLREAGQKVWQMLPLNPTGFGGSPYAAPSAFAGNPDLIALEPLLEEGLLADAELEPLRALPADRVDFAELIPRKDRALRSALERFDAGAGSPELHRSVEALIQGSEKWLTNYALFMALRQDLGLPWTQWPRPLRDRDPEALREAEGRLSGEVRFRVFEQALFSRQWEALHGAAREAGVLIFGDIPIFVALDSADVWANRDSFKLEADGEPVVVAGVPPDYFSAEGQLWGNPHYDWDALAARRFDWWVRRFRRVFELVDIVRVDHFRGFEAAWEVPRGAPNAVDGAWVPGPGAAVFRSVSEELGRAVPIVAEDLGLVTDGVRALLAEVGIPGMKVLQFAFGDLDTRTNPYLPHNYDSPSCVVYTGTHDNDTTRGWYEHLGEAERDLARRYVAALSEGITWELIRCALASVADLAIVPMQDVLDLGSEARMNTPGRADGNWAWRMLPEQLAAAPFDRLRDLSALYGRA